MPFQDPSVKIPAVWERGGRTVILKCLTALRKPCIRTVDVLVQPEDFVSVGWPRGAAERCPFMVTMRSDGSAYMSVDQGETWFILYDPNAAAILVGSIAWFAGQFANLPDGWLYCDGAAVSRATYDDLFAITGTAYGVGNGTTTFNLPDLRSRALVGGNDAESGINGSFSTRSRGQTFGTETHQLTAAQMAQHSHGGQRTGTTDVSVGGATVLGGRNSGNTGSTGGDGTHNNMSPFLVLWPIIKY